METVLTIGAFLAGLIGFFCLSQATMGVGILCLGCLIGIIYRIIQADRQHDAVMATLKGAPYAKTPKIDDEYAAKVQAKIQADMER